MTPRRSELETLDIGQERGLLRCLQEGLFQFVQRGRFDQKVVGPLAHRFDRFAHTAVPRQDHDLDRGVFAPQLAQKLEPIHSRQVHVDQAQIGH